MSFLPSALTIDIEPSSAQEVTLFYKLSEQTYSDLHTKLVVPKYHPQQGRDITYTRSQLAPILC